MFDWVLSVIEGWGYPGIFALMLLEKGKNSPPRVLR